MKTKIKKDYRCVIDINDWEGKETIGFSEVPEEAVCYTAEEYYKVIDDRYESPK